MVERFNRTLKMMLCKHTTKFGFQWEEYIAGALWAYRNVPHDTTGEKPSFLLLGVYYRTPTEAGLLVPQELEATDVKRRWFCHFLLLDRWLQTPSGLHKLIKRRRMTAQVGRQTTSSEIGFLSDSPRNRLVVCRNCLDPGTGLTA